MTDATLVYGLNCPGCAALTSKVAQQDERLVALEALVKKEHTPALHELDDRVDEHDRRFARVDSTLDRLTNAVTHQSLVLEGVDRKLLAIVKVLGVEEAANG